LIHAGPLVSEVAQLQSISWGPLGSVIVVLPAAVAGILARRVGTGNQQLQMPLVAASAVMLFIGVLVPTVVMWSSLALAFVAGLLLMPPRSSP
jgi:hypothetical protein